MKKALIIGINNYPGYPLFGCVNDATHLAELIRRNGDGKMNMQVDLHTNTGKRSELRKLIQDFFRGGAEIALFYFSGHGFVDSLGGVIVTPDATNYDEGIRMDELIEIANTSRATNRIIILDCCYSGAIGEFRDRSGVTTNISEGVTILTSSRGYEPAMEKASQGVFTGLLLQALMGGAADIRGYISPGSIYAYIDQALGALGQRPVFKTNITHFASLREVVPQLPGEVLRRVIDYFPEMDSDHALDPSCEYTNTPDWKPLRKKPYAVTGQVAVFKELQQMQSVGLIVPVDATHMYFAAMEKKSCRLTPLGKHYWRLVKEDKF